MMVEEMYMTDEAKGKGIGRYGLVTRANAWRKWLTTVLI